MSSADCVRESSAAAVDPRAGEECGFSSEAWGPAADAGVSVVPAPRRRRQLPSQLTADFRACKPDWFALCTLPPLLAFEGPCGWVWNFKFPFPSVGLVSLVPALLPEVSDHTYFNSGATKNRRGEIIALTGMGSLRHPL